MSFHEFLVLRDTWETVSKLRVQELTTPKLRQLVASAIQYVIFISTFLCCSLWAKHAAPSLSEVYNRQLSLHTAKATYKA
jgi:hypothetical protein